MPTLAFCSIAALDRTLPEAAEVAARCGLDGLEVTARPPHLDPDAGAAHVREAAAAVRDAGLEVTAYGSYLGFTGPRGAGAARREAERAAALGASRLRVWAAPADTMGAGGMDEVVRLLRAAGDAAADAGIEVVVERHGGTLADTAERSERLLDAVDRENVSLNYQVLDGLPPGLAGRQPEDARRLAPRSRYFHVKNYRQSPEPRGPLVLGGDLEEGALDYRAILAAAVRAGYRGPYAIEFVAFDERPLEEKLAADAAYLREVLEDVGAP